MIEQTMVFALGFLVAGLLALVIAPAFWRRAIRLSTRRLEMLVPLSPREVIAERDLLRAELAVERRKLEQKAAALNEVHAADMAELGRRTGQLVDKDAQYVSLAGRHVEQTAELNSVRELLTRTQTEFAAMSSALYGATSLLERKDGDLIALRRELASVRAKAANKEKALIDFAAEVAMRQAHLAAARDDIARLRDELATLGLERDADAATLKRVAAQLADREEALKIAENRGRELQRRRKRNIETSRSIERRLLEKIAKITAEAAPLRQQLDAARRLNAGLDAAPAVAEQENAILRQNINELGAAIIRMAGLAFDAAPDQRFGNGEDSAVPRALTNVAATSK